MRVTRFFLIAAFVLLPGCGVFFETKPQDDAPGARATGQATEQALPPYVERRTARFTESGTTAEMLLLRLAPEKWAWNFAEDAARPKTVAAWREALGADIVINGSYFTASGTPSGYYRNGARKNRQPWSAKTGYTGAVSLKDGALRLHYLPEDAFDPDAADAVFLTFPTLVTGIGVSGVEKESGLRASRTVLAEDADGTDYIVVTERGIVSLYELARWLREQPEHFARAVNLDGGPSTGLALKDGAQSINFISAAVPNVVAVFAR